MTTLFWMTSRPLLVVVMTLTLLPQVVLSADNQTFPSGTPIEPVRNIHRSLSECIVNDHATYNETSTIQSTLIDFHYIVQTDVFTTSFVHEVEQAIFGAISNVVFSCDGGGSLESIDGHIRQRHLATMDQRHRQTRAARKLGILAIKSEPADEIQAFAPCAADQKAPSGSFYYCPVLHGQMTVQAVATGDISMFVAFLLRMMAREISWDTLEDVIQNPNVVDIKFVHSFYAGTGPTSSVRSPVFDESSSTSNTKKDGKKDDGNKKNKDQESDGKDVSSSAKKKNKPKCSKKASSSSDAIYLTEEETENRNADESSEFVITSIQSEISSASKTTFFGLF